MVREDQTRVNRLPPQLQKDIVAQSMKVYVGNQRRVHQYKRSAKDHILVAATVHKHVGPSPANDKAVRKKSSTSNVAAIVKTFEVGRVVPKAPASSAVTRIETVRTQRGTIKDLGLDPKHHAKGQADIVMMVSGGIAREGETAAASSLSGGIAREGETTTSKGHVASHDIHVTTIQPNVSMDVEANPEHHSELIARSKLPRPSDPILQTLSTIRNRPRSLN